MNDNKEIANTLLEYLSQSVIPTEDKVDLILELLYRANYQYDNVHRYSLSLLKNSIIKKYELHAKNDSINNLPWRFNSSIRINNIESYIVPITRIIPAKYFINSGCINYHILQEISDTVNEYLTNNPLFIKKVFIKQRKKEL